MISLASVKKGVKRQDSIDNNRLHWFSSIISPYITYILLNLKISADLATIIFFIAGAFGVYFFSLIGLNSTLIGYLFFRLHIIVDMVDGNIARFNKTFSIRGSYWDSVIHSVLNPLFFMSIAYSSYLQYENIIFLKLCPLIGLSTSIMMAVKNNYMKALFQNGQTFDDSKKPIKTNIKFYLLFFLSEVLSIEGFLILTILSKYLNNEIFTISLIYFFLFVNVSISIVKFLSFSYFGKTFTKV